MSMGTINGRIPNRLAYRFREELEQLVVVDWLQTAADGDALSHL